MTSQTDQIKDDARRVRDALGGFVDVVIADIVEDWKASDDPAQRERLHAEQRGINRLMDFIYGEAEDSTADES